MTGLVEFGVRKSVPITLLTIGLVVAGIWCLFSIRREFFPEATHWTTRGRRGCVVGQGELKAGGFDPLFSLNHSFAMLRANINRLFRRTWNTTKKPERLALHIALYVLYHNWVLINPELKNAHQ